MKEGLIEMGSEEADLIGFTSDKFGSGSYLWKSEDHIIISFITSKREGNFRGLVEKIQAQGLGIKIPTPSNRMEQIAQKNNYRHVVEQDPAMGPIEMWILDPPKERKK